MTRRGWLLLVVAPGLGLLGTWVFLPLASFLGPDSHWGWSAAITMLLMWVGSGLSVHMAWRAGPLFKGKRR